MSAPAPFPEPAQAARAALNQLDELHSALAAVAELSAPCDDMGVVNRNNLATLLSLLLRLQGEATQRAWEGLQAQRDQREARGGQLAAIADLIAKGREQLRDGA